MILEKYFASLIVIMAAMEEAMRAVNIKIAIWSGVISANNFEMTTRKPALVLSIENNAINESIANEADVNPVKMRNVDLFNLLKDEAIAED